MIRILQGDCRDVLPTLPANSVQCVVTSPPYWNLRDYNVAGQIGLEATPDAFAAELVAVFRLVRRVMRDDATLFLNLGDSYADKQLLMMPARVALALQADGWWLRSDVIWAKPNPMPESVTDRPTSAHEHVFLLTKRADYYFDADAVREDVTGNAHPRGDGLTPKSQPPGQGIKSNLSFHAAVNELVTSRNIRNVWSIATAPYAEAHFATFPPALAERCIRAGTKPGDTVLDPFAGAFTAPLVADRLQRHAIGIELSAAYCAMARARLIEDAGMFAELQDAAN